MNWPPICVVDASVACQVLFAETLSQLAIDLFDCLDAPGAKFLAPDLIHAECANIFWKKVQRGVCNAVEARQAMIDFQSFALTNIAITELATDALDLALQYNISAYDACYVALARRENVPLITADQKLVAKLAESGIAVDWLGSWTPPTATPQVP